MGQTIKPGKERTRLKQAECKVILWPNAGRLSAWEAVQQIRLDSTRLETIWQGVYATLGFKCQGKQGCEIGPWLGRESQVGRVVWTVNTGCDRRTRNRTFPQALVSRQALKLPWHCSKNWGKTRAKTLISILIDEGFLLLSSGLEPETFTPRGDASSPVGCF